MASGSGYAARLPLWVLIGAVLGIATGLLFGADAAVLRPAGTTYVRLMEVAVFPYIISSLLHGLGRLSPEMAWRLFRCSWRIYLGVWGLTLLVIFLMALSIPPVPPPSLIEADAPQSGLDLLDLLIPANPFVDLVDNHLPAIVIFSIVYGAAIQRVNDKEAFLSILDLIRNASVTIWNWIVLLAPLGVFALFADTAGTVALTELADLSLYLIAMICGTGILAFWILPSVIAALCPMSTREVLRELQGALVIAVVTSLSVAALPFIQRAAERLAERVGIKDPERKEIIQTTIAVSYPLAQLGNFFIWLFVLFGAYYFRISLPAGDQIALPFVTLLSGFGSPSSSVDAVASLTAWLGFPDRATNLYVGMMTITRYGQVVASVMGFAFVTLLVTMTYYRKTTWRIPRLVWSLAAAAGAIVLTTAAARVVHDNVVQPGEIPYLAYRLEPDVTEGIRVTIEAPQEAPAAASEGSAPTASGQTILDRIESTGEIRVGFNPHIMPLSYRNNREELVGFDIAFAYQLARDLNVHLRLIPFTWIVFIQIWKAAGSIWRFPASTPPMTGCSASTYQSPICRVRSLSSSVHPMPTAT